MAIRNYKDKASSDIANERRTKISLKKLPANLHAIALGKLVFLDNATNLQDLVNWKSLRIEKLKGNKKDYTALIMNFRF